MVIAKCQRHFSIQSIKSDVVILSSFLPRWCITITWFVFRPSPFSIVNVLIWQTNWNILSHPANFPHRKKSTFRSPIQSHLTKRPHTASILHQPTADWPSGCGATYRRHVRASIGQVGFGLSIGCFWLWHHALDAGGHGCADISWGWGWKSTLTETNSKSSWKLMVGRWLLL